MYLKAESILQQSGYDSNPGPLLRVVLTLSPALTCLSSKHKSQQINAILSVFILAGVAEVSASPNPLKGWTKLLTLARGKGLAYTT